jgi:hypothetical protein
MNPFEEFLRTLFLQRAGPQASSDQYTDPVEIGRLYKNIARSPYFRDTLRVSSETFPISDRPSLYGSYNPNMGGIGYNVSTSLPISMRSDQYPADTPTARNVLTHEGAHSLEDLPGGIKQNFPSWAAVNRPDFYSYIRKENMNKDIPLEAFKSSFARRDDPSYRRNPESDALIGLKEGKIKDRPWMWYTRFLGFEMPFRREREMLPAEKRAFEALSPYYMFAGPNVRDSRQVIGNPSESFAQAFTNAADFLSRTSSDTTGYRQLLGRYEGNTPGMGGIVADLLERNPIYSNHPLHSLIRSSLPKEKKKK